MGSGLADCPLSGRLPRFEAHHSGIFLRRNLYHQPVISAEHFIPVICCFIRLMFLIIAGICLILHFNVAVDSAAIARFKGNLSGGGLSLKGQWKSIGERSDKKLRVGAKMGEHPVQPLADTAMRNAHFPGNFST